MTLGPKSVPVQKPGFRLELLDQEIILLHPDGQIVQCNQTAGAVWQLCDGNRTAAEMASLLGEAFGDASGAIRADVYDILRALAEADAVTLR